MNEATTTDSAQIKAAIRAKIIELARRLEIDASEITDDDIIPATGYLDSAVILELVVWFEGSFDLPLQQEEINIDNLGSIDAMTAYLLRRKGQSAWVIRGEDVTIERIEFSQARVPARNGAGIRAEGAGLTIRDAYFHDNEMGILTARNGA